MVVPEKYKIIPLENIYSIQLRTKNKNGFIMIGLKRGLNKMLFTSQFEVQEHISDFINIIREAIIHYEGGTAKLDMREKLGESYEKIMPICSISISLYSRESTLIVRTSHLTNTRSASTILWRHNVPKRYDCYAIHILTKYRRVYFHVPTKPTRAIHRPPNGL